MEARVIGGRGGPAAGLGLSAGASRVQRHEQLRAGSLVESTSTHLSPKMLDKVVPIEQRTCI